MKNKETIIFEQEYSDEDLYDIERDVTEAIDETFNEKLKSVLPERDKHGFVSGTFKVKITYVPESA